MGNLIGRERELELFNKLIDSNEAEFVAVFGRRRVGKTFLIKETLGNKFAFQMTGIANATTEEQLANFFSAYNQFSNNPIDNPPKNWFEAFQNIRQLIGETGKKKCIVFLDELPWLDTPKSKFIAALEHFWNDFGSAKPNLKLIVCGSAASWIINKIINNRGGLHNRVTQSIHLLPFTLKETEQYFKSKQINLDRYQIIQLYIVMGGIPFYLKSVEKGLSAFQNIDNICFSKNGILRNEYQNLYHSLFQNADKHLEIIEAISHKNIGLTRDEIVKTAGISNGGNTTKVLEELELSGFIKKYTPFNGINRNSLYQLVDSYSLFYHKFIKNSKAVGDNIWLSKIDSPAWRAWSGYAFETVCLLHYEQIKKALGISGIYTEESSWRSKLSENGAQIDLLIDRKDNVITVCEMKFSTDEFTITKEYAQKLRTKLNSFKTESKTRKAVFLAMITTFGLKENEYSLGLAQNNIKMDALFE